MTDQKVRSNFGSKLRKLREKAGLSQRELSRRTKVNQSTISLLESGENSAMWPTILKLCEALGADPNELK